MKHKSRKRSTSINSATEENPSKKVKKKRSSSNLKEGIPDDLDEIKDNSNLNDKKRKRLKKKKIELNELSTNFISDNETANVERIEDDAKHKKIKKSKKKKSNTKEFNKKLHKTS